MILLICSSVIWNLLAIENIFSSFKIFISLHILLTLGLCCLGWLLLSLSSLQPSPWLVDHSALSSSLCWDSWVLMNLCVVVFTVRVLIEVIWCSSKNRVKEWLQQDQKTLRDMVLYQDLVCLLYRAGALDWMTELCSIPWGTAYELNVFACWVFGKEIVISNDLVLLLVFEC